MSTSMHQFYLDRAADAKRDAKAATLANVRARFLTSQSTWSELAARAKRVDKVHAKLVADKAAEKAAAPVLSF